MWFGAFGFVAVSVPAVAPRYSVSPSLYALVSILSSTPWQMTRPFAPEAMLSAARPKVFAEVASVVL